MGDNYYYYLLTVILSYDVDNHYNQSSNVYTVMTCGDIMPLSVTTNAVTTGPHKSLIYHSDSTFVKCLSIY